MDPALHALGPFADAGERALELAIARALESAANNRIPIAAAAVLQHPDGELRTLAVGHNGRIPAPGHAPGYPTDHGETAAIRQIQNVQAHDWRRVVFATTLSPCTMCSRTLTHLHGLGLDKIVVAEAESFPGTSQRLAQLPGMTLVELRDTRGIDAMREFATRYPWDWAADIGEIPPGILPPATARDETTERTLLAAIHQSKQGGAAALIARIGDDGQLSTVHPPIPDRRATYGENPVQSAVMVAMGTAGSALNLRRCVLVFAALDAVPHIDLPTFGLASLGACELFRPAAILTDVPFEPGLAKDLAAAGIELWTSPAT